MTSQRDKAFEAWWAENREETFQYYPMLNDIGARTILYASWCGCWAAANNAVTEKDNADGWTIRRHKEILLFVHPKSRIVWRSEGRVMVEIDMQIEAKSPTASTERRELFGISVKSDGPTTPATPPKVPADCPKCGMQLRLDGECVQCGELTSKADICYRKADICYHCEVHPGDRYCPDPCPKGKSVKGPVEVTSVGSVTKEGGVVSPAMCPRCGLRQLASSLTPEAAGRGLAYRETLTCVQCGYTEQL